MNTRTVAAVGLLVLYGATAAPPHQSLRASQGVIGEFETHVRPLMSQYYSTRTPAYVEPPPYRIHLWISGKEFLDGARAAFQQGEWQTAHRLARHAEIEMPHNAEVLQLLSLIHFVQKEYDESARAARKALRHGKAWDWPTLRGQFARPDDYTPHLRALERYVRERPESASARYLLGYHYLMLGHNKAAQRELSAAAELRPDDTDVGKLLEKLQGTSKD